MKSVQECSLDRKNSHDSSEPLDLHKMLNNRSELLELRKMLGNDPQLKTLFGLSLMEEMAKEIGDKELLAWVTEAKKVVGAGDC